MYLMSQISQTLLWIYDLQRTSNREYYTNAILKGGRERERVKKDLILETPGKHFICLIQYKHLDVIRTKWLSSQHIKHTTRSANNNMNPIRQNALVFTNTCSTNTSMYFYTKIISKGPHHLLNLLSKLSSGCKDQSLAFRHTIVKLLQNTRAESCCLPSSRLSLLNNIKTLTEGNNSPLLNSRGFFKAYTRKYPTLTFNRTLISANRKWKDTYNPSQTYLYKTKNSWSPNHSQALI